MVVSTYPKFRAVVKHLCERNRPNIERIAATMVKAQGQSLDAFCPSKSSDTNYFFLLELEGVMDNQPTKHFDIEDDVKELLLRTKAPKKPDLHLPFDFLFLDVTFTKQDLLRMGIHLDKDSVEGIVVRRGDILFFKGEDTPEVVGNDLRLSVCSTNERGETDYLDLSTFSSNIQIFIDRGKVSLDLTSGLSLNDQKVIADFVVNFIYFVNNPDVKYVYHERGEKNRLKRMKAGKPILPSSYSITLTGETLRYLNEVKAGLRTECRYAFDVRGHYRMLNSPFYKEKRGVRIWVSNFIKGKDKGFIVEKYYDLKEDKTDD
jgi:hypothetical protein